MRVFILEDFDIRIERFKKMFMDCELTVCKTADEAISILEKDLAFDLFLLDHDLGERIFVSIEDENTGSRVAKFLSDKDVKGQIIVHSCNPIGAKNMLYYLPKATYKPFSLL
jgi:CheY-like chemotaxis protein